MGQGKEFGYNWKGIKSTANIINDQVEERIESGRIEEERNS